MSLLMTNVPNQPATLPAIPVLQDIKGWESVPIEECFEKLVSLSDLGCERIKVVPAYHSAGLRGALSDAHLREGVAEKLVKAAEILPDRFQFAVWDAWRPLEVQAALFEQSVAKCRRRLPHLSESELIEEAKKYAARPSEDIEAPYPHSTGGALDLTIADDAGHLLEMGVGHDAISPATATRYYEEKMEQGYSLSEKERRALWSRRLLFHALTSAGFRNYRAEWWHYDFGNQLWAVQEQKVARYGRVSL